MTYARDRRVQTGSRLATKRVPAPSVVYVVLDEEDGQPVSVELTESGAAEYASGIGRSFVAVYDLRTSTKKMRKTK
jgi:hypothetical protein